MNGEAPQSTEPSGWQYKPGDSDPQSTTATNSGDETSKTGQAAPQASIPASPRNPTLPLPEQRPEVRWTALEFVAQKKSPFWYLGLIVITLGLASLILLLSHDKVSATIIVAIGIVFGFAAARQPRSMRYLLDSKGVTVNRAFRPYSDFKSFALVHDGEQDAIMFLPLKRFVLPLSLSVTPEDTDAVVAKLSDYLPNDQTHGYDAMDHFIRRIRF